MPAVVVEAPATSANLGSGFDCLGLALELRDTVRMAVAEAPSVTVTGLGAEEVPLDSTHLVYASAMRAFEAAGLQPPALRLECHNRIPHGRGLGSSSAAIVSGVAGARALGADLSDEELLKLATRIEGHPDNVAPALLGSLTVAWTRDDSGYAQRLPVHPDVEVSVAIPSTRLATAAARGLLPAAVPYPDAVHAVGRTALTVAALVFEPANLWAATEDRLHQDYRRAGYPDSWAMVQTLRREGVPAVISGAGPTVAAFCDAGTLSRFVPPDWQVAGLEIAARGVRVTSDR